MERGAREGCSDAWPGSRLLLRRNPLGWAGLGLGPLNPTPASPRSRAPTESAARALLIHSHSQPKLIKGTPEPQGSCSAAESPSRGELGEGVTRAQMPTNYSVALSRALPGMPDSGRTSLSLSTNVGESPKSGMTQPAPPRTQAATPPCSISPRRKKQNQTREIKLEVSPVRRQRSPSQGPSVVPAIDGGLATRLTAAPAAEDRHPYLVGGLWWHGGW